MVVEPEFVATLSDTSEVSIAIVRNVIVINVINILITNVISIVKSLFKDKRKGLCRRRGRRFAKREHLQPVGQRGSVMPYL